MTLTVFIVIVIIIVIVVIIVTVTTIVNIIVFCISVINELFRSSAFDQCTFAPQSFTPVLRSMALNNPLSRMPLLVWDVKEDVKEEVENTTEMFYESWENTGTNTNDDDTMLFVIVGILAVIIIGIIIKLKKN